jgi:hypothetical protein
VTVLEHLFWVKVGSRTDNGCWPWLASKDSDGYGNFWVGGKCRGAHRVSYELIVGGVPEGLQLDHLCKRRDCVNPWHLEPVTPKENKYRSRKQFVEEVPHTKMICVNGHPYTTDTTYLEPRGGKQCRICMRATTERYRARKRLGI